MKNLIIVVSLCIVAAALAGARGARAEEATSTGSTTLTTGSSGQATSTTASSTDVATSTSAATSTPTALGDTAGIATSTPAAPDATSTPAASDTAASSTPPASEPTPPPPAETPPPPPPPATEPPPPSPVPGPPAPPAVQPVVPFISTNGKGFDPAVAPSVVKLKVIDPKGNVPTASVFVSFIGVGGRSYGGPLDNEGTIKVVMPSGRYYSDFLVVDTHYGPPANPPAFFLEANEERDLGVVSLADTSAFTDTALEAEVGQTLKQESGMAKIFALIVKLLLAILKEIRGLRSDVLAR